MFGRLGSKDVCTKEHQRLALEAARQGIVLLKNDNNFLPLNKDHVSSLAIIGPGANSTSPFDQGVDIQEFHAICNLMLRVSKTYIKKTTFASGCLDVACESNSMFNEALHVTEMELISLVASVSKKRIILVLTGGGPLDFSFAEADSHIASIIWVGYPGEAGGKALAEVIFGYYNPGEAVYEFGHGLSYTNYTYMFLSAPNKMILVSKASGTLRKLYETEVGIGYVPTDELLSCDALRFNVQLSVMNVGHMDGSHVVMLYSKASSYVEGAPRKQLIGFSRIHTTAHRSTDVSFMVDPCEHLSFANEHGKRILPVGKHILMSGELEHSLLINI
uniref:Fibronectin type III-like domain-containing protein n=1 Tax=Chenopodium quinoa TaxID=63459 RepID=A0A803L1Z7_CHEQI